MRRFVPTLVLLLLVALAASACGGSTAPAQPAQNTPVPQTSTPRAGTPVPPSPTPMPISPLTGKRVLANGVWTCPANTAGAMYVGSLDEKEFHKLDCDSAAKIATEKRVCFVDDLVAVKFGYVAAKDCAP